MSEYTILGLCTGALLMQTAVMRAVGGPEANWREADGQMTRWLLSVRYGLNDRVNVAHSGAVGTFDLSKLTDADLAHLESILAPVTIAGSDPGRNIEEDG